MSKTSADLAVSPSATPPIADTGVHRPASAVFTAVPGRPHALAATGRDAALDYLRAFVTVLVVAHHSVIAYALVSATAAPRSPLHPWLSGIPIVDSHRLIGFDLFALFNDTFFMSLMFFLSGLFVGPSLARKGGGSFLRDRALRLGAPFVVMALLAPLAYYPAYRATAADPGVLAFWREWLSLGVWPSGPVWFVAVLLGFDIIAAAVHRLDPVLIERVGRLTLIGRRRPTALFVALMLVSAAAYLPMRAVFGPESWATVGPFPCKAAAPCIIWSISWRASPSATVGSAMACLRPTAAWVGAGSAGPGTPGRCAPSTWSSSSPWRRTGPHSVCRRSRGN